MSSPCCEFDAGERRRSDRRCERLGSIGAAACASDEGGEKPNKTRASGAHHGIKAEEIEGTRRGTLHIPTYHAFINGR